MPLHAPSINWYFSMVVKNLGDRYFSFRDSLWKSDMAEADAIDRRFGAIL